MSKPRILIARTVFPEVVARLRQHFEVTDNQADVAWSKAEWTERLSQHVGAFSMGIDPVDEEVLKACPQLKICANTLRSPTTKPMWPGARPSGPSV